MKVELQAWWLAALNWALGEPKFRSETDKPVAITVEYPEATYDALVFLERGIWQRPRWPLKTMVHHRGRLECEVGIPFPTGRGQDVLYTATANGKTVQDIAAAVLSHVREQRLKHGGEDWRPIPRAVKTLTEARLEPHQRKALKRLNQGKRTLKPAIVMDKYEVHPDGKVYERIPVRAATKGSSEKFKLQRVDNIHTIEQCKRALGLEAR